MRNFIWGILLLGFPLQAQIINTETLRMVTDTTGWAGSVSLSVGFSKNVKEIFNVKNKIHVQFKTKKQLILFMNNIGFNRADGADFVNKGVQHLRYNYKLHPKVSLEAFVQNQYNAISKIDYRRLAGTGIRYKLSKSEKYKAYIGSLLMYETEKTKEVTSILYKDWRNSSYLSFSLYFNKNMKLISTTYYQPQLKKFSDYRVSHQSAFAIKIFKNLAYKTAFNFTYDAFPVVGIPNKEYYLTNGLVYTF